MLKFAYRLTQQSNAMQSKAPPMSAYEPMRIMENQNPAAPARVAVGRAVSFEPAGLPAPDFAAAVYPCDGPFNECAINYSIEPYNCDAAILLLPESCDEAAIAENILAQAQEHFSNFKWSMAGALCLWRIPGLGLALGGFEGGGGYAIDLAREIAASAGNNILASIEEPHFEIEYSGVPDEGHARALLDGLVSLPKLRAAMAEQRAISQDLPEGKTSPPMRGI